MAPKRKSGDMNMFAPDINETSRASWKLHPFTKI